MSLKDFFKKGSTYKILKNVTFDDVTKHVESDKYMEEYEKFKNRFIPPIDFGQPEKFARFGSAELYYTDSIRRVYQTYPYDGSNYEKVKWMNDSTYIDLYIFEKLYPRTTGYINLSADGWGPESLVATNKYGTPENKEYIFIKGGPNAFNGVEGAKQGKASGMSSGSKANIWNEDENRISNLIIDGNKGNTVEFWMKKTAFVGASCPIEVIYDAHTPANLVQNIPFGRFRIEMDSTVGSGVCPFLLTYRSGTFGYAGALGSTLSTAKIADDKWHHYAFTVKNNASGTALNIKMFVDGVHDFETESGTPINCISGAINATLGSLSGQHETAGSGVTLGSGKLSASIDEFRYWKNARTNEEIGRHWWTTVAGGANTDKANVNLGVYFKFNEGITQTSSIDATVLDYSGRISNGAWAGYPGAHARSTSSAFMENRRLISPLKDVHTSSVEERTPIVYSFHPEVKSLFDVKKTEGMLWDFKNNASFYNSIPGWIREEDEDRNAPELKQLCQIISSYFDTLFMQIERLPRLKDVEYLQSTRLNKPNPYAKQLLESAGFPAMIPHSLFEEAGNLAEYMNRDERLQFEETLQNTRNIIYQNIYNNLVYIYKSKGTEKAFRNLIRCYGIDDELLKLNLYAANQTYKFEETFRSTVERKKFVDFNDPIIRQKQENGLDNAFAATVYSYYSGNPDKKTTGIFGAPGAFYSPEGQKVTGSTSGEFFASGSSQTYECEVIFPKKPETVFYDAMYNESHASIFGAHEQRPPYNEEHLSWRWDGYDYPSFRVLAEKGKDDLSHLTRFKCVFPTGSAISLSTNKALHATTPVELISPWYEDIYENQRWNFAVTIKPERDPLVDTAYSGSSHKYMVDFYGVYSQQDIVQYEFSKSFGDISPDWAGLFMGSPRRFYLGAERSNFSGTISQRSDVKIGSFRAWYSNLSKDAIRAHNRDASNHGAHSPYRNAFLFQNSASMTNYTVPQIETLACHWGFNTITSSDGHGRFFVSDLSSGSYIVASAGPNASISQPSRYGDWSQVLLSRYTGRGDHFVTNNHKAVDKNYIPTARQNLPEVLNSSDMVQIRNRDDLVFTRETEPIRHFYAVEKSMYQNISEEMLKMFSTVKDFNNLVGEPVNRYRQNYKLIEKLRHLFYENVNNTPDLDKFLDFYKWVDSSISALIQKLIPASANMSDEIRNVIESHILERNKYWNKFPTLEMKTPEPVGHIKGINELTYDWEFGHAPLPYNASISAFSNTAIDFDGTGSAIFVGGGTGAGRSANRNLYMGADGTVGSEPKFSVAAWVHPKGFENNHGHYNTIYSVYKGFSMLLTQSAGTNLFGLTLFDSDFNNFIGRVGATFGGRPLYQGWQHFVVTYDGTAAATGIKLYVNGKEADAYTAVSAGSYTAMHQMGVISVAGIGATGGAGDPDVMHLTGSVDEITVYTGSITAAQVTDLYNRGCPVNSLKHGPTSQLWAYWKMEFGPDTHPAGGSDGSLTNYQLKDQVGARTYGTSFMASKKANQFSGSYFNIDGSNVVSGANYQFCTVPFTVGGQNNCLWWQDRAERDQSYFTEDFWATGRNDVDQARETIRQISNTNVEGSTYVIRKLTRPYKFSTEPQFPIGHGVNPKKPKVPFSQPFLSKHTSSNEVIMSDNTPLVNEALFGQGYAALGVIPKANFERRRINSNVRDGKGTLVDCMDKLGPKELEKNIWPNTIKAHIQNWDTAPWAPYAWKLEDSIYGANGIEDYMHGDQNHLGTLSIFSSSVGGNTYNSNNVVGMDLTHPKITPAIDGLEKGMQGPFTRKYVGASPFDAAPVNFPSRHKIGGVLVDGFVAPGQKEKRAHFNYLDSDENRVETHDIVSSMKDKRVPFYGTAMVPRNVHKPKSNWSRGPHSPVNIRNIKQTGTLVQTRDSVTYGDGAGIPTVIGNFEHNYQVVQTTGRDTNNFAWTDKMSEFDDANAFLEAQMTTNNHINQVVPSTFVSATYDRTLIDRSLADGKSQKTVIVDRFSAPGGSEVMSRGHLDPESETYSPYNALPYRNLTVRQPLNRFLTAHSKWGGVSSLTGATIGSAVGKINEFTHGVETASFHKTQRNTAWRVSDLDANLVGANSSSFNKYFCIFHGGNEYLNCGSDASLDLEEFTISAWINFDSTMESFASGGIMALGGGIKNRTFYVWGTGSSRILGYHSEYDSTDAIWKLFSQPISSNTWYHVALTHFAASGEAAADRSQPKMYINGVEYSPQEHLVPAGNLENTAGAHYIGRSYSSAIAGGAGSSGEGAGHYYKGFIDEVSVWDTRLSADEIGRLYRNETLQQVANGPNDLADHPKYSNLVSWWRMGDHPNDDTNRIGFVQTVRDNKGTNHAEGHLDGGGVLYNPQYYIDGGNEQWSGSTFQHPDLHVYCENTNFEHEILWLTMSYNSRCEIDGFEFDINMSNFLETNPNLGYITTASLGNKLNPQSGSAHWVTSTSPSFTPSPQFLLSHPLGASGITDDFVPSNRLQMLDFAGGTWPTGSGNRFLLLGIDRGNALNGGVIDSASAPDPASVIVERQLNFNATCSYTSQFSRGMWEHYALGPGNPATGEGLSNWPAGPYGFTGSGPYSYIDPFGLSDRNSDGALNVLDLVAIFSEMGDVGHPLSPVTASWLGYDSAKDKFPTLPDWNGDGCITVADVYAMITSILAGSANGAVVPYHKFDKHNHVSPVGTHWTEGLSFGEAGLGAGTTGSYSHAVCLAGLSELEGLDGVFFQKVTGAAAIHDNYWVSHAIPRSDVQYSWVTGALREPDTKFVMGTGSGLDNWNEYQGWKL